MKNSAQHVSKSTRRIILDEFHRAELLSKGILDEKNTWKELFEEYNFFNLYKSYLRISASALIGLNSKSKIFLSF
jgi:poly(A) polymerase